MTKGLFIIDRMPGGCIDCPYTVKDYIAGEFSGVTCKLKANEKFAGWTVGIDIMMKTGKPDWCPIKPLPEKTQYKSRHSISDEQFAAGWNACIDKIWSE